MHKRVIAGLALFIFLPAWGAHPEWGADMDQGQRAYDRGDYSTALDEWRRLAEAGDVAAAARLGMLYDTGHGVRQDFAQAFNWYRRAANKGDVSAMFDVAVMLDSGRGTPVNRQDAAYWYRLAANLGNARATYNLALLNEQGDGLRRDSAEATRLFALAARRGIVAARQKLAATARIAVKQQTVPSPSQQSWSTSAPLTQPLALSPSSPAAKTGEAEIERTPSGAVETVTPNVDTAAAVPVSVPSPAPSQPLVLPPTAQTDEPATERTSLGSVETVTPNGAMASLPLPVSLPPPAPTEPPMSPNAGQAGNDATEQTTGSVEIATTDWDAFNSVNAVPSVENAELNPIENDDFRRAEQMLLSRTNAEPDFKAIQALLRAAPNLKKQAQHGDARAQYDLGYCSEHGIGIEVDRVRAYAYYIQALLAASDVETRIAAGSGANAMLPQLTNDEISAALTIFTKERQASSAGSMPSHPPIFPIQNPDTP